jgi:hypothetical protein
MSLNSNELSTEQYRKLLGIHFEYEVILSSLSSLVKPK